MKKLLVVLSLGLVMACKLGMAADIPVTQVIFEEVEPGIAPYTTRVLVNKRYLRLDEGEDDGDFTLFDRVKGEIHNYNQDDQSEMFIQRSAQVELDVQIDFSIKRRVLVDAPHINNLVAVENSFFAQGELCKTSVNFAGLLPDVATALSQYQYVLMQQNRKTFSAIPDSVKTPCYLANNYLYQNAYLKVGFPAHVADTQGREKRLLDFASIKKPSQIFEPLKGYRVFSPGL